MGTKTWSFGVSGRYGHDSSSFYGRRLYGGIDIPKSVEYVENPLPETVIDKIFLHSSEHMEELPDSSVHLMVTSPPYNVGKDYDQDMSLDEYLEFLYTVFQEVYRVLVPGGRLAINVAGLGRKPYIPLHHLVGMLLTEIGFIMRGEIIWYKAAAGASSTAWGTWKSPKNPVLRDFHEYILVFSKDSLSLPDRGKEPDIRREEFLAWTSSVWTFPPERAKRVGHPAPFPEELPYRLIKLYTYPGDVVLDPFAGSGTTLVVAKRLKRHFVGYEIKKEYTDIALKRLSAVSQTMF